MGKKDKKIDTGENIDPFQMHQANTTKGKVTRRFSSGIIKEMILYK